MATNQYLPFATAGGANVLAPADYQSLASRQSGFAAGTALSVQLNSVWRQASVAAAMLGQFIGDIGGFDALDDGNVGNLAMSFERTIQSGKMNYAVAGGSPNALTGLMFPVVAAVTAGLSVVLNVTGPNTGPATLSVNGSTPAAIVNIFGAALVGGELFGPVRFTYDGAIWWAAVTQPSLSADRTYFVNASTGSDSNNGLTSGTAFATIQKAVNVAASLNCNGFNLTINVADGTYGTVALKTLSAAASATLTGNTTTPANCITGAISGAGSSGWLVQGFKPTVTGAGVHNLTITGGSMNIGAMEWPLNNNSGGGNGGAHMAAGAGGSLFVSGAQRIVGGATIAHMFAADGGSIRQSTPQPSLNVVSASGFSNFVVATNGSIQVTYTSITGAANVTSGNKFSATANGVINTNGAGINFYPGPGAGTTATGGQYV